MARLILSMDGLVLKEIPLNKERAPDRHTRWSGAVHARGGRSRIRTLEAFATDLQSAPIGRSGNPPGVVRRQQ